MFILTPIAINSFLTSKWAHVCISTMIAASLAISCDSSSFSFDSSDWVFAGKKRLRCKGYFSQIRHFFLNSQQWEFLEMSFKPGAQISRQSNGEWVRDRHFSEKVWWYAGKREDFKRMRKKNEIERKMRHRSKNWPKMP